MFIETELVSEMRLLEGDLLLTYITSPSLLNLSPLIHFCRYIYGMGVSF